MPMHYFIYAILLLFLFYVPTATSLTADDDDLFLTFVKGKPNFEKFCKELEENGKLENIRKLENDNMQSFTNFDQKKDFLIQMYEAHLGVVYLMRKNWKCAGIRKEIKHEKTECEKFRKYLDILYEYLFRVYAEGTEAAADPKLSPAVKPVFKFDAMFTIYKGQIGTLIQTLESLRNLSRFFFVPNTTKNYAEPMLSNEGELNNAYAANSNVKLREQFDQNLKQMLTDTKQNEAAEKAAFDNFKFHFLSGVTSPYKNYGNEYLSIKESEHSKKFDIFLCSPFYGTVKSSGGKFQQLGQKQKQMLLNTKQNETEEKKENDKSDAMLSAVTIAKEARHLTPNDKGFWENFKKRLPVMDEQMKEVYKEMANHR